MSPRMGQQISVFSLQQTLLNAAAELIGEVFGEAARDHQHPVIDSCRATRYFKT